MKLNTVDICLTLEEKSRWTNFKLFLNIIIIIIMRFLKFKNQ